MARPPKRPGAQHALALAWGHRCQRRFSVGACLDLDKAQNRSAHGHQVNLSGWRAGAPVDHPPAAKGQAQRAQALCGAAAPLRPAALSGAFRGTIRGTVRVWRRSGHTNTLMARPRAVARVGWRG